MITYPINILYIRCLMSFNDSKYRHPAKAKKAIKALGRVIARDIGQQLNKLNISDDVTTRKAAEAVIFAETAIWETYKWKHIYNKKQGEEK